jgi:hypothetical protein
MIITNTLPNNIIKLKNDEIIQIEKIFSYNFSNKENIELKGHLYYHKRNVFTYLYKSSDIGILASSFKQISYFSN